MTYGTTYGTVGDNDLWYHHTLVMLCSLFLSVFSADPFTGGDTREFFMGPTASGGAPEGSIHRKKFFFNFDEGKNQIFWDFVVS